MSAVVFDNKPVAVDLEEGREYYFCTCGKSINQPFCDGSHNGSDMSPQVFTAQLTGTAYLCQCKKSGNLPFCDGAHSAVADDEVGR